MPLHSMRSKFKPKPTTFDFRFNPVTGTLEASGDIPPMRIRATNINLILMSSIQGINIQRSYLTNMEIKGQGSF